MAGKIRAIFLDCGDTLVDEATEVKDALEVSQRADLIPGADELVRELKLNLALDAAAAR
jgi:putative hydrolase of the HAD superfamily